MSHPLLQGADVDPVLEVARGICVAEFVEKPTATVGSFGTAIDLYGPVFQLVAHSAMTAVQFSAIRDRLKFFQHGAVWPASGTGEDRIVGGRIFGTEVLEHSDELLREPEPPSPPSSSDEIPSGVLRLRGPPCA